MSSWKAGVVCPFLIGQMWNQLDWGTDLLAFDAGSVTMNKWLHFSIPLSFANSQVCNSQVPISSISISSSPFGPSLYCLWLNISFNWLLWKYYLTLCVNAENLSICILMFIKLNVNYYDHKMLICALSIITCGTYVF